MEDTRLPNKVLKYRPHGRRGVVYTDCNWLESEVGTGCELVP